MKKKTKRKIKQFALLAAIGIGTGLIVMMLNILGPFRSFFWNIPYLSGFLGPKSYLVLLQNNNELRPTGGFITAVAQVDVLFGIPSIQVFDSYQVPNPPERIPAEEPFQYFIGQNDRFFAGKTLRDANFSPDFAKSAEEVISLYELAYPDEEIDGLFSIDFQIMEDLLDMYGPITVDETTFTKDNFFILTQRISKDVDTHDAEQLSERKNILGPFTNALKSAILGEPTAFDDLTQKLYESSLKKHILAFSTSDGLQQKFEDFGIAGQLDTPDIESDFLHVNIANIGGRKADRYITKDVKYRADFSRQNLQESVLEISFEHLGSYNIQSDVYQAYVRVYVPQGSTLTSSSTGGLRPTTEASDLNMTLFADYIRMNPGEKRTLTYRYQLPETISGDNYQLSIQKQPGIQNQFWQVALRQPNDTGMQNLLFDESISEMLVRENLALWRDSLDRDMKFHVIKTIDQDPPIILWQRFVDLSMINIRFQELVDLTTAENTANFQLIDLNEANSIRDNITVIDADFDERDLWLTVQGVTLQPEEKYQLILRDIQDLSGNVIEPNPVTRTLVQRIE